VLNSIGRGVFIGVPGSDIDLIKSIIHQELAGQPNHMARRPSSATSTDSRPWVSFHRLLESVTTKETHKRLQSEASRPATHRAHTSVAFAHCLLVLGLFLG
jgi:hypothetical protein